MNEENHEVPAPDFEGEKMKMPENSNFSQITTQKEESVVNGPLLALIALLLILVLGGLYYWFTTLNPTVTLPLPETQRPTPEENNEPESTTAEAKTDNMFVTSPSDELSAIESDIEATDLDSLDTELNSIDAEMNTALGEI